MTDIERSAIATTLTSLASLANATARLVDMGGHEPSDLAEDLAAMRSLLDRAGRMARSGRG